MQPGQEGRLTPATLWVRRQRHRGPGRDVDVVVVGEASLRSVRRACSDVERELQVEINPVVVDHDRWSEAKPEPFIAQLKNQPLVPIPI